jgi:hypothetical protein
MSPDHLGTLSAIHRETVRKALTDAFGCAAIDAITSIAGGALKSGVLAGKGWLG